jgi:DNA polymerase I
MLKTKRRKRIFVIDGNWYLHRAFHTYRSHRPLNEGLPYHFLSIVFNDALAVKADYLLLAFDGPSCFRYDIYPDYKKRRSENGRPVDPDNAEHEQGTSMKDQVYGTLPHLYKLLQKLNVAFFQPKKHEADDVGCSVAVNYGDRFKVLVGAQDKDGYQYLTKHVMLYDSSAKGPDGKKLPRYITVAKAEKSKGITVAQMVDFQTLIGDSIDDIPNIQGIKSAKAKKILNEYGSIKGWYDNASKDERRFLQAQRENIRRNRKLVTLANDVLPPFELEDWRLPKLKSTDKGLGSGYHDYHAFLWPKRKSLFG